MYIHIRKANRSFKPLVALGAHAVQRPAEANLACSSALSGLHGPCMRSMGDAKRTFILLSVALYVCSAISRKSTTIVAHRQAPHACMPWTKKAKSKLQIGLSVKS